MPKLIALISSQPQLSRDQFRTYYETQHAPLVRQLLPMIGRYTRSYLPTSPLQPSNREPASFDVLTELWFDNQAQLDAFWQRFGEPEVSQQIREDEANFLISELTQMFEVDETSN